MKKRFGLFQIIILLIITISLIFSRIYASSIYSVLKSLFFLYLFIIFFIDIILIRLDYITKNRDKIVFISSVFLITSIPLFLKGISEGQDLQFHLMRIESILAAIRDGVFPVRVSRKWLGGFGYPTSVFYGDVLLYVAALLRLVGFSVVNAYKGYILVVNLLSAIISFCCFRKIFKDDRIAFLASLVYGTCSYRLVNIFVRAAVGEYTATAFLPLVVLALYEMYHVQDSKWKSNSVLLAIAMSMILTTHILTAFIVCIVVAVYALINYRKTFTVRFIKTYIASIILFLISSLYFLIPFISYYLTTDLNINSNSSEVSAIQSQGIYIAQLFAFFSSYYGISSEFIEERMQLTPGLILMLALVYALYKIALGQADSKIKKWTMCSIVLLFVSCNLFPWDYLCEHFYIFNKIAVIQFPWRILGIATVVLTLLMAIMLRESRESYKKGIVLLSFISFSFFVSDYCKNFTITYPVYTESVNSYAIGWAEYLPYGYSSADIQELNNEPYLVGDGSVEVLEEDSVSITVTCVSDEVNELIMPLIYYPNYHAYDEGGNELVLYQDGINVAVEVPKGFNGMIRVIYKTPVLWNIALIISALFYVGVAISFYQGRKDVKN